jgi:hypothetical protein
MMTDGRTAETALTNVEVMERRVRFLIWGNVVLGIACALLFTWLCVLTSQINAASDLVKTKRVEVIDEHGDARILLESPKGFGPSIAIHDSVLYVPGAWASDPRLILSVSRSGAPSISFLQEPSKRVVWPPVLGRIRLTLGLDEKNDPGVAFAGTQERSTMSIGMEGDIRRFYAPSLQTIGVP